MRIRRSSRDDVLVQREITEEFTALEHRVSRSVGVLASSFVIATMIKMGDDTAGPMLGWSLGTGLNRRSIDDLQEFPCVFTFKAVGVAGDDFVSSLLARVSSVIGRPVKEAEHHIRDSKEGRYTSVTLELFVTSGDEVYSIYEAIHDDQRIRFML